MYRTNFAAPKVALKETLEDESCAKRKILGIKKRPELLGAGDLMLFCDIDYFFAFFLPLSDKILQILGFACCTSTADKENFLLVTM